MGFFPPKICHLASARLNNSGLYVRDDMLTHHSTPLHVSSDKLCQCRPKPEAAVLRCCSSFIQLSYIMMYLFKKLVSTGLYFAFIVDIFKLHILGYACLLFFKNGKETYIYSMDIEDKRHITPIIFQEV
jgi:hypothetical protein